ncbi:LamG-like jellyroll fold domain-containing protein [Variovorax sp. VaC1]|uniref:LamG-like jellyroll fold domain-containing protein n=1 Tax=Variovorax sp. VaC1 TaxID=3373132 RepID=UPI00374A8A5F
MAVLLALSACGGGGGGGASFPLAGVPPTAGTGNPTPTNPPPIVNQGKSGPKALVVEIDGLTHAALRDAIAQKKATALQAFQIAPAWTGGANGTISEQRTSDNPGWATLLTGSWVQRHGVRWDTSDQRIDAKLAPSIFALAKKNTAAGYKTAAVTANSRYPTLLGNETGTVDAAVDCAGSDTCVTERASQLIDAGQDLIVAQYGAPAIAAAANGLKADGYQRAVADTSAAVGQLLARIAQRTANDAKEDWLVIVTTGHGLDAFGASTGLQTIDGKTIFIASNKNLAGLPGTGAAAPADNTLLQLAAATDIAPTVLRHLGTLPTTTDYRFNGQALQAATSLRSLAAKTGADKASIELSWTLASATTAPVLVIRDGKLVATLPPGSTAYTDPIVAASDGIYTYQYTVVAGETIVALTAQIAYVKPAPPELPVPLAATLVNGLLNYYPLDTLPATDIKNASTLAPWAADANGGTVVDDGFKPPYKVKALRVDSTVKNASGMAGYRLVQNSDVTTNPAVTTFTIGFWMRTDNICSQGVSNGGTVIGNKNYTTGGNPGLAIGLFGSCEIRFNVGTGSARADSNGYSLSAGQWAYVAVTIDKVALTMKGYVLDPVKGIQANSTTITSAMVDKLGGLGNGLGLNEDGTGLYYQRESTSPRGAMDFNEFAIWNRALTNDELTSIFKSGQPLMTLLFP